MGRCYATVLAAAVAGIFTAQGLAAQQPNERRGEIPGVEPGARVRITTAASSKPVVGWVDTMGSRDIRFVEEANRTVVTIPRDAIRRIERSGIRRSTRQRAVPGLIAGGLLGLVVGLAATEEKRCDSGDTFCIDAPERAFAGIAGLGIGMLAGGLISWAIIPGESWEDASLPTLTAGADPRGGYLALRIPLGARRRK